jgi:hypothetical protein
LEDVGFEMVERVDYFSLVPGDCSSLGFDTEQGRLSVSLNMVAFKPEIDNGL